MRILALAAALALLAACGGSSSGGTGGAGSGSGGSSSGGGGSGSSDGGTGGTGTGGSGGSSSGGGTGGSGGTGTGGTGGGGSSGSGWVTLHEEHFEGGALPDGAWAPDPVPDDGPYADAGAFFQARGVTPPRAYRVSVPFGDAGWLTAEGYTLDAAGTPFSTLASVVADPEDPSNHALRVHTPVHSDALVVRPSAPLPDRYRVSLRVGHPSYGDGLPGANGYPAADAGAHAGPWLPDQAVRTQNGFYWLAILDAQPRPHNNVWIHHHRKVVVDSDNNDPPWTDIWNGSAFVTSGTHPVDLLAIDGRGTDDALTGKPFLPYAAGSWQPSGTVRSVDAYLPDTWYTLTLERDGSVFTFTLSGRFAYGGQTTYSATIDASQACVWHFNRSPAEENPACASSSPLPGLGPEFPSWPAGTGWPDWFMFGDPHENFYAGDVLYDDVKLEVPAG